MWRSTHSAHEHTLSFKKWEERKKRRKDTMTSWKVPTPPPPNFNLSIFQPNAHTKHEINKKKSYAFVARLQLLFFSRVSAKAMRWCANNMMNVEKHLTFSFSSSSSCSLFCMSFCFVIRSLIVCRSNVYSSGCVSHLACLFFPFVSAIQGEKIMKKRWQWKSTKWHGKRIENERERTKL